MFVAEEDLLHAEAPPPAKERAGRRRTTLFILCSPRPRVGRTLIARMLTEFLLADGRQAEAFDLNPGDPALSDFLPAHTTPVAIGDTFGQMALFDHLIIADGRPKVVDVGHTHFDPFFDLMDEINFLAEAKLRAIDIVILYVAENHARSAEAFLRLQRRFPGVLLVAVHNQAIEAYDIDEFPAAESDGLPMQVAALSPHLQGVVERPGFSFAAYLAEVADAPTGLSAWIGRIFIAFRDLELRLMLEQFGEFFRKA